MADNKKESEQAAKQEARLEDLPVEESKQDEVKGGLAVIPS
jgi:hypothetical protein